MSKMNSPNKLTLLRLCLVPVIMIVLALPDTLVPWEVTYTVGLLLFAATATTDVLDGRIARSHGLVTNFGKFVDPVADKFMVIGTLMVLVFRMMHPELYGVMYQEVFVTLAFVVSVLIIFRELAITSLRLVLVNSTGQVVAAKALGKIKTLSQVLGIGCFMLEPLVYRLIAVFAPGFPLVGIYPLSYVFIGLMAVFTVWSGIDYIKGGWKSIATDW